MDMVQKIVYISMMTRIALPINEEQGPNLDDPNYDGNNDG